MAPQFWQTKKAAAIFQHELLDCYLVPWAQKVGVASPDHRVALLDGYAGKGRYEDGSEGSPALALRVAGGALRRERRVECDFVEAHRPCYEVLSRVVHDEAGDITANVIFGDVADAVDRVLRSATGVPLLAFLDPFGLPPDFETISRILTSLVGRMSRVRALSCSST